MTDASTVDDLPNDWGPRLADLARRKATSQEMGGPEKIVKHHARGSDTVREWLDHLLDAGTFRELRAAGGRGARRWSGDGVGRINGCPGTRRGEDFTVLGGSIGVGELGEALPCGLSSRCRSVCRS